MISPVLSGVGLSLSEIMMKWLFFGLLALFILPIWIFEYPVLADYPYHLFKVHVLKEYLNPLFQFSEYFTIYRFPCFHSLGSQIILLLSKLLPLYVAGKIFLTLYVVLLPLSAFYFLRSYGKNGTSAIFSFALVYNSFLHKGNLSFVLSISVALFLLGYLARQEKPGIRSYVVGAVSLLFLYLLHPYAFSVVCLLMLVEARLRKFLIIAIPSIIVIVVNVLTLPGITETPLAWLSPMMKIRELGIYFFSFSYLKEGILLLPVCVMYLYLFFRGSWEHRIGFLVLLLVFVFLPDQLGGRMGGEHVAQRILPFAICFGLLSLKETRLSLCIAPLLVLHLLTVTVAWQKINNVYHKYYTVLRDIPRDSEIVVHAEPEDLYVGQIKIFGHFQFYRLIEVGGMSEPAFFEGPPVFYTGKPAKEKWIVKFRKSDSGYDIKAIPLSTEGKEAPQ